MIYLDPAVARTMMESSLGVGSKPDLTPLQLDTLFELATLPEGGWSTESLTAVVAAGWRWKAALVSNKYELSGGGATLKQDQWFKQCMEMAKLYTSGEWVVGSSEGASPVSDPVIEADEPFFLVGNFLTPGETPEW